MAKRGRPQEFDVRFTVALTRRQSDALHAAAIQQGVPVAQLARDAFAAYLSESAEQDAA